MKKYTLFSAALVLISFTALKAQSEIGYISKKHEPISGLRFGMGIGYLHLDPASFGSLSNSLGLNGYARPGTDMSCADFTVNGFAHNVFFEMDFAGLAKRNATFGLSRTTDSLTCDRFAIGYAFIRRDHFLFYPAIAFSTGHVNVHSHQMVKDTIHDVAATNNYRGLDFSLNFDFTNKISETDSIFGTNTTGKKLFSRAIGISAGFMMNAYPTYWNDKNIDVYYKGSNNVNFETNVVGISNSSLVSMYYVRLKLNFGWVCRKIPSG